MQKGSRIFCGYTGGITLETRKAFVCRILDDDSCTGVFTDLEPRFDLCDYRPAGFEWWDAGDGSLQLSLAILADYLGDDERALRLYPDFTWKVIAGLPRYKGWAIGPDVIDEAVASIEALISGCP